MSDIYDPRIELKLDNSEAIKKLNEVIEKAEKVYDALAGDKMKLDTSKVEKQVKGLEDSLKGLAKTQSAATKQSLDEIAAASEKTRKQLRKNFKASDFDPFSELNYGLLKDSLNKVVKGLSEAMGTVGGNLSKQMSAEVAKITESLNTLSSKMSSLKVSEPIEIVKPNQEQSIAKLIENIEAIKRSVGDLNTVKLDLQTDFLDRKLNSLKRTLTEIRNVMKEIDGKTFNVNITNKGFNAMIEHINKISNSLERTIKQTSENIRKATENQEELTQEVEKTSQAYKRVEQYAAETGAKLLMGQGFGGGTMQIIGGGGSGGKNGAAGSVGVHLADTLVKSFFAIRGIASVFQQMQRIAYTIGQYVQNISSQIISTLIPAIQNLISDGIDAANTMERAKIGYQLFFPNENPRDIQAEIQRRAVINPVFDATDLSKYVAQLAPLSDTSELAIDAIEGIATVLASSGQEVSTYMQRLVTNTQQVVSTGKATARDWNEFLRAAPVFETALKEVSPAVARKVKDGNGEITKSDTKYLLQALQAIRNDSSLSGVLDVYARTYEGRQQQMRESMQHGAMAIIEQTGLYGLIKRWLDKADDALEALNRYFAPFIYELTFQLSKIKLNDVKKFLRDIYTLFTKELRSILEMFGIDMSQMNVKKGFELIKNVLQFMLEYFKGYLKGIKALIDVAQTLVKTLGLGMEPAELIGFMASPFGAAMVSALNAMAGAAQVFANFVGSNGIFTKIAKDLKASAAASGKGFLVKGFNLLSKTISGLLVMGLSNMLSNVAYNVTQELWGWDHTVAQGVAIGTNIVGGIAGGAMIGSAFGPWGTVIGGIGGGIVSSITGLLDAKKRDHEYFQRIYDETKKINQQIVSDNIVEAAKAFVDDFNAAMEDNGWEKDYIVDTGSNAGFYALQRLENYMATTDVSRWNKQTMADLVSSSYQYKRASERIAEFASKEMQDIEGKTKFNLKEDIALRDELAKVIKGARLLQNVDYDSYSKEELVSDFLDGADYTKEQLEALVKKYEEEKAATNGVNAVIKKAVISQQEFYGYFTNFDSRMSDIAKAMVDNNKTLQNFYDTYRGRIMSQYTTDNPKADAIARLFAVGSRHKDPLVKGVNESSIQGLLNRFTSRDVSDEDKNELAKVIQTVLAGTDFDVSTNDKIIEFLKDLLNTAKSMDGNLEEQADAKDIEISVKPSTESKKLGTEFVVGKFKFAGGVIKPAYKASGGLTRGVDTVPAMLQRGEFVVRKAVVDKVGLSALNALNLGDPKLAAALMSRPNITNQGARNSWSRTSNDNRRSIRQYVKIVNKNSAATLNSGYSLANRLAMA